MAELARDYHNNLQTEGLATEDDLKTATERVLENIEHKATEEDKHILSTMVTEIEVSQALKSLPNGKAAGMDGIPCELWKILQNKHKESVNNETPSTDHQVKIL